MKVVISGILPLVWRRRRNGSHYKLLHVVWYNFTDDRLRMKNTVVCDVTHRRPVKVYKHSCEILIHFHQTTRRHIPEDCVSLKVRDGVSTPQKTTNRTVQRKVRVAVTLGAFIPNVLVSESQFTGRAVWTFLRLPVCLTAY